MIKNHRNNGPKRTLAKISVGLNIGRFRIRSICLATQFIHRVRRPLATTLDCGVSQNTRYISYRQLSILNKEKLSITMI